MEFLKLLEGIRIPALTGFMSAITYLGDEVCFMAMALLIFWCIDKRRGYYVFIVGLLGTVVNQFLKLWFRISRPWVIDPEFTPVEAAIEGAGGYSFPSGHTQTAVGTYGSIALGFKKAWVRWLCLAVIVIVPFSRMYLGVHTPLDVGVSYLIGGGLAIGLYFCFKDERSFEKCAKYVFVLLLAACVAYAIFVFTYTFPENTDAHNLASGVKNACTVGGTSLALLVIYIYDTKKLNFSTEAPLLGQLLKLVLGLALVVAIKSGFKPVLNAFFGLFLDGAVRDNVSNFVRYFLMGIFAGCIWPHTFPLFAKLGKK